jgi:hypothetical protein
MVVPGLGLCVNTNVCTPPHSALPIHSFSFFLPPTTPLAFFRPPPPHTQDDPYWNDDEEDDWPDYSGVDGLDEEAQAYERLYDVPEEVRLWGCVMGDFVWCMLRARDSHGASCVYSPNTHNITNSLATTRHTYTGREDHDGDERLGGRRHRRPGRLPFHGQRRQGRCVLCAKPSKKPSCHVMSCMNHG